MDYNPNPDDLDLAEEEEALASLEVMANDIQTVVDEILANKGVSQRIIRPLADALPPEYPLASFTQSPSETNLAVSLETLSLQSAGIIAAIAVAAAAVLASIVAWLAKMFSGSGGTAAAASTASDNASTIKKASEAGSSKLNPSAKSNLHKDQQDVSKDLNNTYAERWTGLAEDVFAASGPVKAIRESHEMIESTLSLTDAKLDRYMDLVKRASKSDPVSIATLASEFDTLAQNGAVERLKAVIGKVAKVEGTSVDFRLCCRVLSEQVTQQAAARAPSKLDLDKLSAKITSGSFHRLGEIEFDHTERLKKVDRALKLLQKLKPTSDVDPVITETSGRALRAITAEFQGVQFYYLSVKKVLDLEKLFCEAVEILAKKHHNLVNRAVAENGDAAAKEALDRANQEMRHNLKK